MKPRLRFIIIAMLATFPAGVKDGRACTCLLPPPPAEAFAEADAVLMGKIISFEQMPSEYFRAAQLTVLKIWKGNQSGADTVFTGLGDADCGFNFRVGETYVIYAYKTDNDRLFTDICTRTNPLHQAAEDLKFLESFSFLPLAIGNTWEFANGNFHYEERILDTLRINGHLYYRYDHFANKIENALLRMTDAQELIVRIDTTEQVWLNFTAEVGEKWRVYGPDVETEWTVHLQSKSDTVKVPAGTFFPCHRFYFQFNGADNDWVEWYAPNVGPVKRDLHGFAFIEYPLQSAIINGVNFPTSVFGGERGTSIREFDLAQNYPNPLSLAEAANANEGTVIRYRLTKDALVILTIYDLLGREIKTLVQRHNLPGEHTAIWDGTNSHGEKVPAGIYVYRMQVGDLVETKKLVVVR